MVGGVFSHGHLGGLTRQVPPERTDTVPEETGTRERGASEPAQPASGARSARIGAALKASKYPPFGVPGHSSTR
jgi:hypothetical protein